MLQSQALASMLQEYDKAYSVIAEKTKALENFRDDYKALRNRLKTLPDKIEYDALVPLGTKALASGKIIHTNEILCMLGDSWFMECSAKTAVEIVDRRIKACNKHIESQKKEAERLENWRHELTKLILESTEEDSKEIVELVSDEEYERMEKEHRENVRKHYQEVARERVAKTPEERKKEEEDFWARLEELELEEEMQQAQEEYEKLKKRQGESKVKPKSKQETPVPVAQPKAPKPKVAKSVSFNNEPEIREIPSTSRSAAFNYTQEYPDEPEPFDLPSVPPQEVVGISNKIVERAPPAPPKSPPVVSASPDDAPGPSTQSLKAAFDPREVAAPPKKASVFKQRRNQ